MPPHRPRPAEAAARTGRPTVLPAKRTRTAAKRERNAPREPRRRMREVDAPRPRSPARTAARGCGPAVRGRGRQPRGPAVRSHGLDVERVGTHVRGRPARSRFPAGPGRLAGGPVRELPQVPFAAVRQASGHDLDRLAAAVRHQPPPAAAALRPAGPCTAPTRTRQPRTTSTSPGLRPLRVRPSTRPTCPGTGPA